MKWNKIKRIANYITFNTPIISIGIAALIIFIVYIVANNSWVSEFYVSDAILTVKDDNQAVIIVELDNDFNFDNGFNEAYWYLENETNRKTCVFVNEEYINDKLIVTYIATGFSLDKTDYPKKSKPITIEIVKRKITLRERILGGIL